MNEYLWDSPSVQRVLMLLTIMLIGYILRGRFPNNDAGAIQKMLLQILLPANLFVALSKESIEWSHMGYIAGGIFLILVRLFASAIVSFAVMGFSEESERATLRRTAVFELATSASALSVLPFVNEFIGAEYVGVGGMVVLPMQLYILAVQPLLMKKFGVKSTSSANNSSSSALVALLKDPIPCALFGGVTAAFLTGGGGVGALGFVGKAIATLSTAQTPTLFLLIGFKLNVNSERPLYGVTLLLGVQGFLLILASVLIYIVKPNEAMTLFMLLFVQGAPSILSMGVMKSVLDSGVGGYSCDWAFDIVGLGFPLSSFMQCLGGVLGEQYEFAAPFVGTTLIGISVALRVAFRQRFIVRDAALVGLECA